VHVRVRGVELPGRRFDCYDDVQVGLRVGRELSGIVAGDAREASWEADVRVREVDDGYDFTGPAVRGRRGDRSLGLAWLDGHGELFRAAKLRLDRVPAAVVSDALRADTGLVATVRLTDSCGAPICASVPESHISWEPSPGA
jgi:hypothetical protein